jgi:UDP-N-acetylglucosamine diphosphorylase/glucosamine-1-phosphate N-acetyltransferase
MKVVFLCGGVGKRMSPLSEGKSLLRFLGKTLLEYHIEQAKKAGLKEFVIISNPPNIDKVKAIAQSISGIKLDFAIQKKPQGMGDALQAAQRLLTDEPIVVVNPDDVLDSTAYTAIIQAYRKDSADSYILAHEVKEYFPGGYLVLGPNEEVKDIKENPGEGKEPSNLVNVVVHIHTRPKQFLHYIASAASKKDDIYEQALTAMIKAGQAVKAVIYKGFWKAIKYPWDIFPVTEYFLKQGGRNISPKAQISKTAVIEGGVVIEDGVEILENAVIKGLCYIGRNCVIGNNVLIRDNSHIGEGCVVGYGTEIKNCYIGDNCQFHQNYFGDSIIGNNCSFGAGTVSANLRLDEKEIVVKVDKKDIKTGSNKLGAIIGDGVRTGIHVGLMPGVRVGEGCFVGPHVCLTEDLPSGKMALAEKNYEISEADKIGD